MPLNSHKVFDVPLALILDLPRNCIIDFEDLRCIFTPQTHQHMATLCQDQHSIMNFAVLFLKLLTLYMLWRAQFLIGLLCRLLRSSDLDLVTTLS